MTIELDHNARARLLTCGRRLEVVTLAWNMVGVVVSAIAAIAARSVALAGFGLDSLIEIGASTVVLWRPADVAEERQRRRMQLIGVAFTAVAVSWPSRARWCSWSGFTHTEAHEALTR